MILIWIVFVVTIIWMIENYSQNNFKWSNFVIASRLNCLIKYSRKHQSGLKKFFDLHNQTSRKKLQRKLFDLKLFSCHFFTTFPRATFPYSVTGMKGQHRFDQVCQGKLTETTTNIVKLKLTLFTLTVWSNTRVNCAKTFLEICRALSAFTECNGKNFVRAFKSQFYSFQQSDDTLSL